ncbi:MAG: N-acetyltransferase [Planctomycetes bacterium]|nr:N-acetyltransferase [Planctomycetota bacterium]
MSVIVRTEQPGDEAGIFAIHTAAFPIEAEARLVDHLRTANRLTISLVATDADKLVGHIAFSPVTCPATTDGLGLAPVAVLPEFQRQGIGSLLIRAGLTAAVQAGAGFVVVLGDPAYYSRFRFMQASRFGLQNEYGADAAFMVLELRPNSLPAAGGLVRYAPEFSIFGA